MKKLMLFSLSALVLSGALSSCKKGDDDPFLSLRSRKARVEGSWDVTSVESTFNSVSSNSSMYTTNSYSNGTLTQTTTSTQNGQPATTATTVSSLTLNYAFEKDGTYTSTEASEGGTRITKGTWFFLGKSKKNDVKNKEAIQLTVTSQTQDGETINFTGLDGTTYLIRQLKNKEMVLTIDNTSSDENYSGTNSSVIVLSQK